MMGWGHAATGAAAWVALTANTPFTLGVAPMSGMNVAAGAILTAGAALLPDADHHNGTIAHSLPPVSKILTRVVGKIAGGHRRGTHSLVLAPPLFGLLALGLSYLRIDVGGVTLQLGAGLLALVLTAFAARVFNIKAIDSKRNAWLIASTGALLVTLLSPQYTWWLPAAVILGTFVHILGDLMTVQGCPVLLPFSQKSYRISILGKASSGRSVALGALAALYAVLGMVITPFAGLADDPVPAAEDSAAMVVSTDSSDAGAASSSSS